MAVKTAVNRAEFQAHIMAMNEGSTDVSCIVISSAHVHETDSGQDRGPGSISFWVEEGRYQKHGLDKPYRYVMLNDEFRGRTTNLAIGPYHSWDELWRVFDEEEQVARERGDTLQWIIGERRDRRSIAKETDQPDINDGRG